MTKGNTKKKDYDRQVFYMKGNSKTYYKMTVSVIFDWINAQKGFVHPSMRQHQPPKVNLPTFNHDQRFFTPTFKLSQDSVDIEHYQEKHQNKIQQNEPISSSEIVKDFAIQLQPRPKDKRYCHVCEQRFNQYNEHIKSEKHLKTVREDKYQRKIEKLSRKIMKLPCQTKSQKSVINLEKEESYEQPCSSKENQKNTTNFSQQNISIQ